MKKKSIQLLLIYITSILNFEFLFSNSKFINSIITLKPDMSLYVFSLARLFIYLLFGLILYLIGPYLIKKRNEYTKNKVVNIILISFISILSLLLIGLIPLYKISIMSVSMIIFIIIYLLFILLFYSNNFKLNILLICSVTFIYCLTADTFHPIDEKIHFYSSYNLSIGNYSYKHNFRNKSLDKIQDKGNFNTTEELQIKYDTNSYEVLEKDLYPLNHACKLLYIPSSIGIFISTHLYGTIADTYFIGRIFNSLAFILGLVALLKLIPFKLNTFVALACTPALLLFSGTYSVDGLGNISMMLFIAYIFKIYFDKSKNIKPIQILHLILFGILILLYKNAGYFFIFGLLFLIYKKVPKKYRILYFLSFILILFVVYLRAVPTNLNQGDVRGGNTNMLEQLHFLLSSPKNFIIVYAKHTLNLLDQTFIWGLNDPYFYSKLSYYTTYFYIFYLLYMSLNFDKEKFTIKNKILIILISLLLFYFTSTGLYLSYTEVGSYTIAGYQSRYIWIMLLLGLLCLNNKSIKSSSKSLLTPFNMTLVLNIIYVFFAVFTRILKAVL